MITARVIPALLLRNESLVKTVRFGKFSYIGDPCNTVRIFNELEVDELVFLDITATLEKRRPNLRVLKDIANECFMPMGYGGGIRSIEDARSVFDIGFEKVAVNTAANDQPQIIEQLASHYGSQAVIASIDVKKGMLGGRNVMVGSGRANIRRSPVEWARELAGRGAGEILLTSIDREGTWSGLDLELISLVSAAVNVPVIAHGGVGCIQHIAEGVKAGASAVAVGSMVVFQKKDMGVLVNMPDRDALRKALA
jgi:imidazole glycerol-phosphate synthase subunit HisF